MTYLKAFAAAFVAFLVVDLAWIAFFVRGYYESQIPGMLSDSPNGLAAALFYVAYVAGIVFLAVGPAISERSVARAATNGIVLGGIAYGTYTVTNYAIFDAWTAGLVASDILWGMFLTATCAVCGYLAARG